MAKDSKRTFILVILGIGAFVFLALALGIGYYAAVQFGYVPAFNKDLGDLIDQNTQLEEENQDLREENRELENQVSNAGFLPILIIGALTAVIVLFLYGIELVESGTNVTNLTQKQAKQKASDHLKESMNIFFVDEVAKKDLPMETVTWKNVTEDIGQVIDGDPETKWYVFEFHHKLPDMGDDYKPYHCITVIVRNNQDEVVVEPNKTKEQVAQRHRFKLQRSPQVSEFAQVLADNFMKEKVRELEEVE